MSRRPRRFRGLRGPDGFVASRAKGAVDAPWVLVRQSKVRIRISEWWTSGYTAQGIRKAIDRAGLNDLHVVKEKGGKVTIHTLRHTFASRLVQAGVSLAKVSKLLGHSSVTTTEIYAHLAPNEVSEEAVMVLNRLQSSRWFNY